MFGSGHARLLVAFIVAMAVHGLLFVGQSQQSESYAYPSMQIELLAQPRTQATAHAKQPSDDKSTAQKSVPIPQHIIAKKTEYKPTLHQQTVALSKPIPVQQTVVANIEEKTKPKTVLAVLKNTSPMQEQQDGEDTDRVMPVDIQKKILTQVSYPMRARRLGWEGRAEFQVNVRNQDVQQVTMLLSTGHAMLDHAAQKGIVSIASLPLSDGSYRLPVVFRLQ